MLTTIAVAILATAPLQCPALTSGNPDTIRVATYAYPGVDRRVAVAGVANYLTRSLRIPARVDVLPDPVALANALRRGEVDVGVINVLGYLLVAFDSTVVVPGVTFGVPATAVPYDAALAAKAPIDAAALRARAGALRIAFVSPGSTTGNLFPRVYLASLGIATAESSFRSVTYAGTHAKAFELLRAGEVDVAALAGEELDKQLSALARTSDIRSLWRSGNLPLGPVMLSCRMGGSLRADITRALGAMHRADSAAFAALKGGWVEARASSALVAVDNNTYEGLRRMLGDPASAKRLLEQIAR
jgi:phosphonate transport system substrate-binding protein